MGTPAPAVAYAGISSMGTAAPAVPPFRVHIGGTTTAVKGEDHFSFMESTLGGERLSLMMVADGHGGKQAVEMAKGTLRTILASATGPSGRELNAAATATFESLQEQLLESKCTSGSTLTVCCINATRHELHMWNVGDSLPVLIGDKVHTMVGTSHRLADNADEVARVVASGARVGTDPTDSKGRSPNKDGPLRAWPGGMTITRAIGDSDCPYISAEPAHATHVLPPNGGALVVCSTGVWDRMSAGKVAQLMQNGQVLGAKGAARTIVGKASRRRPLTDTTAVVMLFGTWGEGLLMASRNLKNDCHSEPHCLGGADQLEDIPDLDAWTVHDVDVLMADVRHGIARDSTAKVLLADSAARDPLSHAARVLRSWRLLGEVDPPAESQRKMMDMSSHSGPGGSTLPNFPGASCAGGFLAGLAQKLSSASSLSSSRPKPAPAAASSAESSAASSAAFSAVGSPAAAARPATAATAAAISISGAAAARGPPRRSFERANPIRVTAPPTSNAYPLRQSLSMSAAGWIGMYRGMREAGHDPASSGAGGGGRPAGGGPAGGGPAGGGPAGGGPAGGGPAGGGAATAGGGAGGSGAPGRSVDGRDGGDVAVLDKIVAALRRGQQAPAHSWLTLGHVVDARDTAGNALLHVAAAVDKVELVEALLRRGASLTAVGADGLSPLHVAALNGRHRAAALLLRAGAPVDALDPTGATPLMLGCARGRVAIVSLLLSHNAAVVTADNAGRTAAMRAQAHRHKEILLLLKRHQQGMLKRNMRDISRPQLVSIQEPLDETRPASPEVPSSPEVPASPREPLPSPPTPKAAAASSTPEDGAA